jgi:hypothetical protein
MHLQGKEFRLWWNCSACESGLSVQPMEIYLQMQPWFEFAAGNSLAYVLWNHLLMKLYKLQLIWPLKPNGKHKNYDFCCDFKWSWKRMVHQLYLFLDMKPLSTSAAKSYTRTSKSGVQKVLFEHEQDSQKSVWFSSVSQQKVYDQFFLPSGWTLLFYTLLFL